MRKDSDMIDISIEHGVRADNEHGIRKHESHRSMALNGSDCAASMAGRTL
jgi:hypothetical protein